MSAGCKRRLIPVSYTHLDVYKRQQVDKAMAWLEEHVKKIHYDGRQLTPEKLQLQIRHYEAIKQIIREHHYDFVEMCIRDSITPGGYQKNHKNKQ